MSYDQARTWLSQAQSVTVLSGAGISAESGVPTFRGAAGLWKRFRPEELATPSAFSRDPELVWEWYDWRRGLLSRVEPNPGHWALAKLEDIVPRFTVVTQNVDGLHQRAGVKSVLEVHGSIWRLRCSICQREWVDRTVPLTIPPRCDCGGLARPGVVWFGEALPAEVWEAAERAILTSDLLLVVGTSAVVYPAAGLVPLARAAGAKIIEVNLERTPVTGLVDCAITGRAGEVLPKLISLS
jgi:NAD-dependent deacetylase